MERLQRREEDENDSLVPEGTVAILLSNVEELLKVQANYFLIYLTINPCMHSIQGYENNSNYSTSLLHL